jgi:hypothetical protein
MSSLAHLPEVVGFFSYSREDDEAFEGTLSALRDAIQRELSAQLGRSKTNLRLWQDQKAIAPGKLWEAEIKKAVEQAVFFIPIVTPRAVISQYCKFEFEAFLAREQDLGRADLVFPLLYIRVPALESEAQWRIDPVLSIVGMRQYVDWRPLRHLDVRAPTVREQIERFCDKIVEALREPWVSPEERRKQRELEAQQSAEEQRAEAARQAEAERQRAEAAREAEAKRQRAEAARQAEAEGQRAEAARRAEEEKQKAEPTRRMPRIAIVYRREDSAGITGRISDRLIARYGADSVTRNVDNIPIGIDFRDYISGVLAETDITLVVVGLRWLGAQSGRRWIDDPADPVRVEIETALRNGMPVVPVLVEGGAMPNVDQLPDTLSELVYRNGLEIDAGHDFDQHIERLIRNTEPILALRATELKDAEQQKKQSEVVRQGKRESRRAESTQQVARIAITYRRDDSAVITGRIFDRLVARYGAGCVFRDLHNIPLGVDFREYISDVLAQADVILVVVGNVGLERKKGGAESIIQRTLSALRSRPPSVTGCRSFQSWWKEERCPTSTSFPIPSRGWCTATVWRSMPVAILTSTSRD